MIFGDLYAVFLVIPSLPSVACVFRSTSLSAAANHLAEKRSYVKKYELEDMVYVLVHLSEAELKELNGR